jgi:hypothetical protein
VGKAAAAASEAQQEMLRARQEAHNFAEACREELREAQERLQVEASMAVASEVTDLGLKLQQAESVLEERDREYRHALEQTAESRVQDLHGQARVAIESAQKQTEELRQLAIGREQELLHAQEALRQKAEKMHLDLSEQLKGHQDAISAARAREEELLARIDER